jgi:hypothetical protein
VFSIEVKGLGDRFGEGRWEEGCCVMFAEGLSVWFDPRCFSEGWFVIQ